MPAEDDSEGLFLVRESPTVDGAFILSVRHQGEPRHYQINRHGADAFFSIGLPLKHFFFALIYIHYNFFVPLQKMDTLFMALMLSLLFVRKRALLFLDHLTDLAKKICHLLIQGVMEDVIYCIELPKKVIAKHFSSV